MLNILRLGVALAAIGLFGCGGGGGGGDGGGGGGGITQPSSTPVAITSANSQEVAGEAIEPAIGGTSSAFGAVVGVEATSTPQPRALTRALRTVARQSSDALAAPQTAVGVAQTLDCPGGSGTLTVDFAADGTSATIVYSSCSLGGGSSINGSVAITGISGTVGLGTFSAAYNINITFTESGSPAMTLAGNFSISGNCPSSTNCTITFAGTSLSTTEGTDTAALSNFSITETETAASVTVTASYTVSSTDLGGALTVATVSGQPLVTATGDLHPQSGQVLVTGLNSRIRVTILSSSSSATQAVRVELDATNDGTFETTNHYSWAQLEAA